MFPMIAHANRWRVWSRAGDRCRGEFTSPARARLCCATNSSPTAGQRTDPPVTSHSGAVTGMPFQRSRRRSAAMEMPEVVPEAPTRRITVYFDGAEPGDQLILEYAATRAEAWEFAA